MRPSCLTLCGTLLLACYDRGPTYLRDDSAAGIAVACSEGETRCEDGREAACQSGHWRSRDCELGCSEGRCRDCSDGEVRCADTSTVSRCENGRFVSYDCGSARCEAGSCRPSEERSCHDAGTGAADDCPSDVPLCHEGECRVCNPGSAVCLSDDLSQVCSANGMSQGAVACPNGCDPSTGGCAVSCDAGSLRCRGRRVVERCRDDGGAYEVLHRCEEAEGEVCAQGECQRACDIAAATLAPAGCSFVTPPARYWLSWKPSSDEPGQLILEFINPDPDLTAQVSVTVDGSSSGVLVRPASTGRFTVPAQAVALQSRREAGGAIRIVSTLPILTLTHHANIGISSGENAFSGDAAYLLPEHLLRCGGGRYRVLAHPGIIHPFQHNRYSGGVAIVSLSDESTSVQLTDLKGDVLDDGAAFGPFPKGASPIVDLQPGEVVFLMTAAGPEGCETCNDPTGAVCSRCNDLTGTLVVSDTHPVAVFSTGLSRVPLCNGCHVQTQFSEQLPPVDLWRNEHVAAVRRIPVGRPTDDERWVFVSDRDSTYLRFEPVAGGPGLQLLQNAGDQFIFDSASGAYGGYRSFRVTADDGSGEPLPILAGRYYHTGNGPNELKAGSSFEVERPVRYWRNEYWFSGVGASENRVQLIVPQGERPLIDGSPLIAAVDLTVANYDVLSVSIPQGLHRMTSVSKFSLLAYGYEKASTAAHVYGYVGPLGFGDQSGCGN